MIKLRSNASYNITLYMKDETQHACLLQHSGPTAESILFFSLGRVNLVDLQQAINVDFSHVETKVNEIVKSDKRLNLVLGQLIDE